ncbi:Fic family protein [Actinoplanes sp. NEAU-A12]|uniref:Fic family protein n=1 Tax=Actinoplanes sandaracinus TaxID=3045177 RepID=A0ABT6WFX5_9ACTN|nr:Fic family protein [Actinoplanes sandaracinus]MDI6098617.1 Fic family protein [Actinoplanes sandaracinus]
MLFPLPELTDADREVLAGIDEMRRELRYQVQDRPTKWTSGLRKFLTADAVAASNSIEGFRVSTADVQDLMDGEQDVDVSTENRQETLAYLVSIHPWADGNGRMSRSLQTLMIAREGVLAPEFSSIEAWLGRPGNTWEYYRELERRGPVSHPDQDVSRWIRFNLTAYHQQAQTVRGRMSRSAAVWTSLMSFADSAGLDERVVSALHDVALVGRIRRNRYEQAEGLTRQQSQRDLRDLTAAGLLETVGRTRARYYTAGPRFPEGVLEVARTPMTLSQPYADALG